MTYVYDILLNFNNNYYEFFDWNLNDNIVHIRRIPLIRLSKNDLNIAKINKIKIDTNILEKIKNKTEVFTNRNIKTIKYACLFTSGESSLALEFDDLGNSIKKSSMLIDEESDINDSFYEENLCKNVFKIKTLESKDKFKTRKEEEIYKYIKKELKNIDNEKLKYLYFECFNNQENDIEKINKKLNKEIDNNWNNIYKTIYNFLKLTQVNH